MDIINSKVETALKKKTKHNKPQNTSRTCPVESKFLMKILRVYIFPSKNMNVCLTFCEQQQHKKKKEGLFLAFKTIRKYDLGMWCNCFILWVFGFCLCCGSAVSEGFLVQIFMRGESRDRGARIALSNMPALEAHTQPAAPREERARGSLGCLQSDSRHRVHLLVVLTQAPCCSAHKLGRAGAEWRVSGHQDTLSPLTLIAAHLLNGCKCH